MDIGVIGSPYHDPEPIELISHSWTPLAEKMIADAVMAAALEAAKNTARSPTLCMPLGDMPGYYGVSVSSLGDLPRGISLQSPAVLVRENGTNPNQKTYVVFGSGVYALAVGFLSYSPGRSSVELVKSTAVAMSIWDTFLTGEQLNNIEVRAAVEERELRRYGR